jgi:hypothetical protein
MSTRKSNIPLSSLETPFTRATQLCNKLVVRAGTGGRQLQPVGPDETWLTGYPGVSLDSRDIAACLLEELPTPKLDKMYPYLWLVATQSSAHISPLHSQRVCGREIIITENPELHLVWVNNKIFLKPFPTFLLSYDFWELYLSSSASGTPFISPSTTDELRRAALGYARTYHHLIHHESDFRIAKQEYLIPSDIEYADFTSFISGFGRIRDEDVSLRYHYGQLRLSRLNLWAKISLRQWNFHKVHWQYGDIFAQFYGPILFLFAVLSVILSAMQVGTQARPEWSAFVGVSAWFSVLSLLVAAAITAFFSIFLALLVLRELSFALRTKFRK